MQRRTLLKQGSLGPLAPLGMVATGLAPQALAAERAVSKTEIVLGSIQDLSGPLASLGKPIRDGLTLRVEQANAAGGVHGRQLRLRVEDSGCDPKKAVLAADKLVSRDKVFAVVGTLGTAPARASMPPIIDSGVLHLFPITAHHGCFEPFHKLKFAAFTPYPDSMRAGLTEMLKKGYKRVALLYQDDEYGLDIQRGTEAALKAANLPVVERASYKRGATDFSSQMQRLRAANPDLIGLATVVRETIGAVSEARKRGTQPLPRQPRQQQAAEPVAGRLQSPLQ